MLKPLTSGLLLLLYLANAHAQHQFSVSGQVLDETGQPMLAAHVHFPELEKGTIADMNGRFHIVGLPRGKFLLHISFVGYETEIRTINVADRDIELTVNMVPSRVTGKEVVISGGRYSSQHKNAVKIDLIKAESMENSGLDGVVGNLSRIPGVDLTGNGGAVVSPVIRGLSTNNILMVNNGIRLENYQFSSEHPYLVDGTGLNQVEIIKGPASMLYGSDAIGGIINIVDDYTVEPNSISGQAGLKYSSNTDGYSGSLGMHGNHGIISWSLHGSTRNSRDFRDGGNQQVINSRYTGQSLKSFLGFRFDKSIHRLRYEYQKLKPGMVNPSSVSLVTDNNRKSEYWYQDLDNHLVSFTNAWFINQFKVHANASYQKNFRRLITDEPEHHAVDMDLRTITYETRAGLVTSEISEFNLSVQGMNQQNRNRDGEIKVLPDYSLNDIGFFGLVQHDFPNKVHVQVGFRMDNRFLSVPTQTKARHSHDAGPPPEPEIQEGFDRYYGNLSGSLGATFEIGKNLLLRSNIASAYRAPSVAELAQDGEHGIRYEQGNEDLKSQRNYELDMSLHYHTEILMLDLAGYYNYVHDYIYLSPTTDSTDEDMKIYRYQQNNAALYGFEGLIEVHPLKKFGVKFAYNLTRGTQSDGDNLPLIPQDKLLSEIIYSVPGIRQKGSIYLKFGADYAFAQTRPSMFETETPSWFIVHAGVGMKIPVTDHVFSLSLQVRNLFNTRYTDHLSVLKEIEFYNMGRNVVLSVSIPFHVYTPANYVKSD